MKNKLSINQFRDMIEFIQTDYNRYLFVNTDICRYGQSFTNGETKEKIIDKFLDFYYPLYQSDFDNHLESENLPY